MYHQQIINRIAQFLETNKGLAEQYHAFLLLKAEYEHEFLNPEPTALEVITALKAVIAEKEALLTKPK